jgi:hypothetical protein
MRLKIAGLVCLLVATTGFGFHNWHLVNRASNLDASITQLSVERDLLVQSYDRFREAETRKLLHEVALNIGLLFAKLDLKLSGGVRPRTEEGIRTAEENMLKADRKRLLELAFAAASSKGDDVDPSAYASDVDARLGDMSDRQAFALVRDEVVQMLNDAIQRTQNKRDALKKKRHSLLKQRDGWYVTYLFIQILGIGLTVVGEKRAKENEVQERDDA